MVNEGKGNLQMSCSNIQAPNLLEDGDSNIAT